MIRAFTRLAFSSAVKAAQTRYGAREHGTRLEQKEPARDRLNADLISFIGATDSFFIATASLNGWPYVQHRGGPPGFLKVVDERTLAFADYSGNQQHITVGNLSESDRVLLFIIDYERGRRLKLWGRGTVIDRDEPGLFARIIDVGYAAKVEPLIRVDVKAWDLNCNRNFPRLVRMRSERDHSEHMT